VTQVEVLRAGELTPTLLERWSAIQRSDPGYASPFFHPRFTQLVAQARSDVRVAVLHDGDRAAGFFPFQRNWLGIGYPAGWGMCDYQGAVVQSGLSWSVPELMRACGLRSFQFDHLPVAQEPFSPYQRARSVSPLIDLSQGFERYERAQQQAGRGRTFSRLRSRWRRLQSEHGAVRFEPHVDDPTTLARLLEWKADQYRRTGMADLLARPWFRQVIESAASASSDGFSGVLSALYAGARPVALHLGLRSDQVWHYWLPAHDVDESLSRCSPGLLLILAMTQSAESMGISWIDFGKGDARHKREFANSQVALAEGSAGNSPIAQAVRLRRRARSLAQRSRLGPRVRRLIKRAGAAGDDD